MLKKITAYTALLLLIFASLVYAEDSPYDLVNLKEGKNFATYPKIDYKKVKNPELVKKGEYLTKMGDCIACHTDTDNKNAFAGGLPVKTPFGTIYSPNITPDKKTGIATWSNEDFIRAMREGVSPSGSYYFPVFPYPYFNRLSDEDLIAIKAYLDVIPAIEKENKEPDMPIPFRWRFMQLGWRMLFFTFNKGEFKNTSTQSAQWNRGAYIVEGLGHCSMCHTPINFLGAAKKRYYLAGGFVDGFHAPNINSAHFKDVPAKKIVNVFKQNHLITGGEVVGPMAEVNHNSLMHLHDDDLKAIAVYLKSVKAVTLPKPKSSNTVSLKAGKRVYNTYCTGCHSVGAGGAPKVGDAAEWEKRIAEGLDKLHERAIYGIGGMPPKGGCSTCSDNEIISAVNYMVEESESKPGAVSDKRVPSPKADTSIARGEKVYEQFCAACHNKGTLGAPMVGDKDAWRPIIQKGMPHLLEHAIKTYKHFPGFNGDTASIIAAVKYMVETSKTSGNYELW